MINPAEGGDFHLAKTGDFGVAVDIAETVGVAVEVEHDGAVKEALDGNVAERRSKEARSPSSQSRPSDRPR